MQNFPQFVMIHRVKGFGIVSKAEIDVFLELFCFFSDPVDVFKDAVKSRYKRGGLSLDS